MDLEAAFMILIVVVSISLTWCEINLEIYNNKISLVSIFPVFIF